MDRVKVGLIGNGGICNVHLGAYQRVPERAEVYALCDINRDRALEMAKRAGVPEERVFTDVHEMVKLKELDSVDVCTWNNGHAECTIAALNAGKNVLCEKPMALNAKQAEEMKAAADKAGKLLMVGFVRRYGNDMEVLQNLKNEGVFGDFYYANVNYTRRNGCPGGWFSDKSRSGGGPLIDLGVHVIDFSRYLMGNHKPVSVYGATFDYLKNRPNIRKAGGYFSADAGNKDIYDVEDLAVGMIRFDNGSVININAAFSLDQKTDRGDMEFFGTKGGAKLNPELEVFSNVAGYMTNVQFAYPTSLDFNGLFDNEINHYLDCITKGVECKSPAEDGVWLMKILDGIYESARTGHEVSII